MILEFIADIDPVSLPLWAVVLLSAAMYPLGFLFGSCSACCCRSDSCEGFDLEEAFSCRNGGFPLCFRSPDLLSLQFTSPCFGSGAAGTVQGTGADVGAGPLTGVTLTNGGSGYAILGRRAPLITLANEGTVQATTTVNLSNQLGACDIDFWRVESVTVTNGGRGYTEFQGVVFEVESGGVTTTVATGRLITRTDEPTLTATAPFPGTGAAFEVTMAQIPNSLAFAVSAVSVIAPGAGYTNGASLNFSTADGTTFGVAAAIINTNIDGEITSVTVQQGGAYAVMGVLDSVEIFNKGNYHYSDPLLPSYVRPPNITVIQTAPYNQGSGAQITATVDGDPASPTFGSVTGLTLANAGTNYLAWYRDAIEYLGDGKFALGTTVTGGTNVPGGAPRMSKGCWVAGNRISFGTRVTDVRAEVLEEWVLAPKKGCCRFSYVRQGGFLVVSDPNDQDSPVEWNPDGPEETITETSILNEADCTERFETFPALNIGDIYGVGLSTFQLLDRTFDSWDECLDCDGNATLGRDREENRVYTGRYIVTVDPPPESSPEGCVNFCGRSGLCQLGAFDETFRFGEDQTDESDLRRMCIRWLCRCYVATGKRFEVDPETEEPLFPDPYDWYEVESTTEVGGPVVFGGTITEKLEAAESDGRYGGFEMFEHDVIFGQFEWGAAEDSRLCLVYAFVFYGTSEEAGQDKCQFPDGKDRNPKVVEAKDVYQIIPCDRCSCQ